jgi:hypothetical protein
MSRGKLKKVHWLNPAICNGHGSGQFLLRPVNRIAKAIDRILQRAPEAKNGAVATFTGKGHKRLSQSLFEIIVMRAVF